MTMTLIETKTLASAAASIEFTEIPQDGTDLLAVVSARSTSTGTRNLAIALNGSSSGFSGRYLFGNGSTTASGSDDPTAAGAYVPSDLTANTFSNVSLYFPNYSGATNKSVSIDSVIENNATDGGLYIKAMLWSNTAAITSMSFTPNAGDLAIGTTISLYGITKGSDGIVTTS